MLREVDVLFVFDVVYNPFCASTWRANVPDLVYFDFFMVPHGTTPTTFRSRRARSSGSDETCNTVKPAMQIFHSFRKSLPQASSVVIELPYSPVHRIFDLHRSVAADSYRHRLSRVSEAGRCWIAPSGEAERGAAAQAG